MVGILLDTTYAKSVWCKNLYESLTARLREKRISYCEILDSCDSDLDTVFIIASELNWTTSIIKQLNSNGINPILLCNQYEHLPGCIYNCVCSDIDVSMKNLVNTLKTKNKSRIALYGINTSSIADISRVDSLFNWKEQHFETMQVFNNNGSLEKCFRDFDSRKNDFDAAICANDFVAVSLVRKLKESNPDFLDNFYVISCVKSKISAYYRKHILSLNMNFEQYGEAAVYIYEALKKHTYLSGMTTKVLWSLNSDKQFTSKHIELNAAPSHDPFYKDTELNEMLIVDKLLDSADDIEQTIIDGLLRDDSLERIAESCFLTVGGIKYRIKKMISLCGAKDKSQMINLLKKYIS